MFDNLQLMSLIGVAGILEVVGGALLLIGLFTRPVAFILSGQMAVAYFIGARDSGQRAGADAQPGRERGAVLFHLPVLRRRGRWCVGH